MKGKSSTNPGPKPPEVPVINRETGAVSDTAEYQNLSQPMVDGWSASEDPFEGGVSAINFNDEMPADQRAKAAEEFHRGPGSAKV